MRSSVKIVGWKSVPPMLFWHMTFRIVSGGVRFFARLQPALIFCVTPHKVVWLFWGVQPPSPLVRNTGWDYLRP